MRSELRKGRMFRKINSLLIGSILVFVYVAIPLVVIFGFGEDVSTASANSSEEVVLENNFSKGELNYADTVSNTANFAFYPFELTYVEIDTPEGIQLFISENSNVDDILNDAGITYKAEDIIEPSPEEVVASGAIIKVIRVENQIATELSSIPFNTIYENNPDLELGIKEVVQNGASGELLKTYNLKYENSVLVSKDLLSEEVVRSPIDQIVSKGTKKLMPRSTLSTQTCTDWDAIVDTFTDVEDERRFLKALMRCESGCNEGRVSSNGKYHGLFQFSPTTFKAYGGQDIYNGKEQIPHVLRIYRAGAQYTQFPGCTR